MMSKCSAERLFYSEMHGSHVCLINLFFTQYVAMHISHLTFTKIHSPNAEAKPEAIKGKGMQEGQQIFCQL